MTLGEKIKLLREREGMTQQDLAQKLNIAKKTLIRYERAETMPDLEKIVELSKIFGVSTDLLIKDEISIDEKGAPIKKEKMRNVSYAEAKDFLRAKFRASFLISLATFIIMLSPGIMLLFITIPFKHEEVGVSVGLSSLFLMIASAVCIYMYANSKTSKYDFLYKDQFEIDYGVTALLQRTEEQTMRAYTVRNIFATALCIISIIPTVIAAILPWSTTLVTIIALNVTLIIAGIGVVMFIRSGVMRSAISMLKETSSAQTVYSKKLEEAIGGSFWTLTVAIYLTYSFLSGNWHLSWIIFVFAASISGLISAAFNVVRRNSVYKNDDSEK